MTHPTYVLVKLLEPAGPDDAQNLARHIVQSLEFADVESARPCYFGWPDTYIPVGQEVSCP